MYWVMMWNDEDGGPQAKDRTTMDILLLTQFLGYFY